MRHKVFLWQKWWPLANLGENVEGMSKLMVQKNDQMEKFLSRRTAMPHPIVCLDERLRKYLHSFDALFSRPQFEHFVTVLVALLMSLEGHTLSHLHRAVAGKER